MPCYSPIGCWIHKFKKTDLGKTLLVFSYNPKTCSSSTPDMQVPCGKCIGCKLQKSKEWSIRCMHEASLYWRNCWLTLTLSDTYLHLRPNPYSLQRGIDSEMTLFIKRLRNKYGEGIRYFYCAEYGETCFFCNKSKNMCSCGSYHPWRGRPHYHMCVFNHDFDDKRFYKQINGKNHYNSESLDALWTDPKTGINMGYATISDLTYDSAAYTARYTTKKITGDMLKHNDPVTGIKYYERVAPSGEIISLEPEFCSMSRGSSTIKTGGIGKGWLDSFSKEVLDNDTVYFKDMQSKPPSYYDKVNLRTHPDVIELLKEKRIDRARKSPDNTPERLNARHYIAQQKAKTLHRKEI